RATEREPASARTRVVQLLQDGGGKEVTRRLGISTGRRAWTGPLDVAEVGPGEGIAPERAPLAGWWLQREREERARGSRFDIPLLAAALLARGLDIFGAGLTFGERGRELVEVVQVPAPGPRETVEEANEQRAVVLVEREHQRQDGVPTVVLLRDEEVAVEILGERALEGFVDPPRLVLVAVVQPL